MGEFVRPRYEKIIKANGLAFVAFGVGQLTWYLYPLPSAHWMQWVIFVCAFAVTFSFSVRAFRAFQDDYRLRKAWEKAQRPSTEKHDGRWATYEEMAATGMYDGVGRLLGTDIEGRLLFEPHRLKPTFHYFLGGQGAGKTSTQVIGSAVSRPSPRGSVRSPRHDSPIDIRDRSKNRMASRCGSGMEGAWHRGEVRQCDAGSSGYLSPYQLQPARSPD